MEATPCSLSATLAQPFCSPLTTLLFTLYIATILTSLYIITSLLYRFHNQRRTAYQRLGQQQTEIGQRLTQKYRQENPHAQSSDSMTSKTEELPIWSAYSTSTAHDNIKQTIIQRPSQRTRYTDSLIKSTSHGTISQRRMRLSRNRTELQTNTDANVRETSLGPVKGR